MSIRDPYLSFLFQEQEKDSSSTSPQEDTDPFVGDDPQEEAEEDPFVGDEPNNNSEQETTDEESESAAQPATQPETSAEDNLAVTSTPTTTSTPDSVSNSTELPFNPLFLLGLIPLALVGYFAMHRRKMRRAEKSKHYGKRPAKRYREKVTPENLKDQVSSELLHTPDSAPVAAIVSGSAVGAKPSGKSSFRTEDDPEWSENAKPVLDNYEPNENGAAKSEDDLDEVEEESFDFESGDFELGQPTSEVKSDALVDAIENNANALESGSIGELDFDDESVIESIEANLSNEQPAESLAESNRAPADVLAVQSDEEFDMDDVDFDADIDLEELEQINEEIADQALEDEEIFKASAPAFASLPAEKSEQAAMENEGLDPNLQLSDDELGSFDDFDSAIEAQGSEQEDVFAGMDLEENANADAESADDLFDSGDYEDLHEPTEDEEERSPASNDLVAPAAGGPSVPSTAAVSGFSAGKSLSSNEDSSTSVIADSEETLQELAALQSERDSLVAEKAELHRQLQESQAEVETLTVNDKLPEMESELESLRQQLTDHQAENTALQDKVSQLEVRTKENEELNEEVESLNSRLQVVREQLEEAKAEVPEDARMEWELSTADLKRQLEEQAQSFESTQLELQDAKRRLDDIDRSAADTDIKDPSTIALIKTKLDQRKVKISKLQQKLRQKIELVSDLESKNRKAQTVAEEARKQADEVEHQLFDIKQKQDDSDEQQAHLAKQLAEMESRAMAAEEHISDLKASLKTAETKASVSSELEKELDSLKRELAMSKETTSELEQNVGLIEAEKQTALSQAESLQSQLHELKEDLASVNEEKQLSLQQKQDEMQATQQETAALRQESESLRQQLQTLKDSAMQNTANDGAHEEIKSLKKQLSDYQSNETRLKEELNQRSSEIQQVSQRMNVTSTQSDTLRDQLAAAQQKLHETQTAAAADRVRVAELEAENRAAQFQAEVAQQQLQQLQSASNFANEQQAQIDAQQIQITKLIEALDSAGQLSKLQSDYSETRLQLEKEKTKSKKRKASSSNKPTSKSASNSSADKDDLTQIGGIGSVMQTRLRKAGVTSFDQIAAWTNDDIQHMSDQLNLKNRVAREKWVSQAKKLSRKKR